MRRSMTPLMALAIVTMQFALPAHGHAHLRTSVSIPMRDVPNTLAADIYLPAASGSWPVILIQTPYNKNLYALPFTLDLSGDPLLESPDYAFVVADWRGYFGSAGAAYSGAPTRGEDGYDTVEWVAAQSWCDGNVGTWGASALGNVQMRTAAEQPPHLKGCVPIVYHYREWYDQNYVGGVYARDRNDFVYSYFGTATLVQAHPYKDVFWNIAEGLGAPADINVPMLHISGWYDHESTQTIREMRDVRSLGGVGAQGKQRLLIGPWSHGGVGDATQNERAYPVAEYESSRVALEFFDFYLRGIANDYESRADVTYYRINADTWEESPDWPPSGTVDTSYFLRIDGSLATLPSTTPGESQGYVSDPTNPVPSLCGPLIDDPEQGPCDQSSLESRGDVLTFSTGPLSQPLTVEGSVKARLWISCDAVDTDLVVRLCDVLPAPDGRSMMLVNGIRRASLRNSYTTRELLQVGQSYEVEVTLPPVSITFPAGHEMRILVSPSHDDLFDVNNQDGSDLSDEAGATPTSANITMWMDDTRPSRLVVPVLPEAPSDLTPPEVLSVLPLVASPTNSDSISFAVEFSEAVTGLDALADLEVLHTGTANTGGSVSGSGASYTVVVDGISGDGEVRLRVPAGAGIEDVAGNPLTVEATSSPVLIDNTPPGIGPFQSSPAEAARGQVVVISVSANEPLALAPVLTVNGAPASFLGEGKSAVYEFEYTIPPDAPVGPASLVFTGDDLAGNGTSTGDTAALTILAQPPTPLPGPCAYPLAVLMTLLGMRQVRRQRAR